MKQKVKTLTIFIALVILQSCIPAVPMHPPYTIEDVKEGDGCCDIYYRDENGNKDHKCTDYTNMKKYKKGDVINMLPI